MKVVVYGTLKKGGRLHRYMGTSKFLIDVAVTGFKMYDTGFGYPFVIEGADEDKVWGEKYEIDDRTLKKLDMIEGIDEGLFKRVDLKDVKGWSDKKDSTYIYVGNSYFLKTDPSKEIKNGIWDVNKN